MKTQTIFENTDVTSIWDVETFERRLIVKKIETLKPEYQDAKYQLVLACGGFGCRPDANGRAVMVRDCCDGEHYRINREDILGISTDEAIAKWKELYGEFDESVRERLEE